MNSNSSYSSIILKWIKLNWNSAETFVEIWFVGICSPWLKPFFLLQPNLILPNHYAKILPCHYNAKISIKSKSLQTSSYSIISLSSDNQMCVMNGAIAVWYRKQVKLGLLSILESEQDVLVLVTVFQLELFSNVKSWGVPESNNCSPWDREPKMSRMTK